MKHSPIPALAMKRRQFGSLGALDDGLASLLRMFGLCCLLVFGLVAGMSHAQAQAVSNASFVSQSVPANMVAGRAYTVAVTMKNSGTTTWSETDQYRLGALGDNLTWRSVNRIVLNGRVAPGQEYTFQFEVRAPATAGTYPFQWQMVQEYVQWFGAQSTNSQVAVSGLTSLAAWPAEITPLPAPPTTLTRVVSYEYDTDTGLLTKQITEPDTPQLRVETAYPIADYDNYGNQKSRTVSSPATGTAAIISRNTSATYDTSGRFPQTGTNEVGQVDSLLFDGRFGTPTSVKNINGLYTTLAYDDFGRKKSAVTINGMKTGWTYLFCSGVNAGTAECPANAKYLITQSRYAADGVTLIAASTKTYYDGLNRQVQSETVGFDGASVIKQSTNYDAQGNVYQSSRPYFSNKTAMWTTSYYDVLGRVTSIIQPDDSETKYEYLGLTKTVTNALSYVRTNVSDPIGRTVQVKDSDPHENTMAYQYDPFDNLVKTTDAKQNTVYQAFDKLGHKIKLVDPDLGEVSYENSVLGQVVSRTDAKKQITTSIYDKLGRQTNRNEPDLKSTWTYDTCTKGLGKLCATSADNGYASSSVYDEKGRLSRVTTTIDGSYDSSFTYDTKGRLETETYPTGFAIKYAYTDLGNLKEVSNAATGAIYWTATDLDASGQILAQKFGNGIATQQVFHAKTGALQNIYAGPGNSVQNLSFSFDPVGNLLSRSDANQALSETFLYDALNRVTTSTVNAGTILLSQTYAYDSTGNITLRSDVGRYNNGARNARPHAIDNIALLDGTTRFFEYDANGNLKKEAQFDAANTAQSAKARCTSYTSFDMPRKIAIPTSSAIFNYGPDHQRTKMLVPGATTIFVHRDNAGSLTYEKEIRADQSVEHKFYINVAGQLVAVVKQVGAGPQVVNYLHQDHLGSLTAVTNKDGQVLERFAYEPFGKRRTMGGALDPSNQIKGSTTDRGFTAHEHLDGLGLIHMNGRIYDPAIGRFMSADPTVSRMSNMQSFNRYAYVENNPLNAVDPSGFTPIFSGGTTYTVGTTTNVYTGDWSTMYGGGQNAWTYSVLPGGLISPGSYSGGYNGPMVGDNWSAAPVSASAEKAAGYRRIAQETRDKYEKQPFLYKLFSNFGSAEKEDIARYENWAAMEEGSKLAKFEYYANIVEAGVQHSSDHADPWGDADMPQRGYSGGRLSRTRCRCFVAGTMVHTKSGLKAIETLVVGDMVAARDEKTDVTAWKAIIKLIRNGDKKVLNVYYTDKTGKLESLGVTPEHPFMLEGHRWVEAGALQPNDKIMSLDGQLLTVKLVTKFAAKKATFNFEVADFNTYFVGATGAWVHNIKCDPLTAIRRLPNITITDVRTNRRYTGTAQLGDTLDRILNGGSHPHPTDRTTFENRVSPATGLRGLPVEPYGYYTEFVVPSPFLNYVGPQRIISGRGGERYYTPDHYETFIPLN